MSPLTWSVLLSVVSVTGVHLAVRWPRLGWPVCLAGEALWVVYATVTGQWGFYLAVVAYVPAWWRHTRRAWRRPAERRVLLRRYPGVVDWRRVLRERGAA